MMSFLPFCALAYYEAPSVARRLGRVKTPPFCVLERLSTRIHIFFIGTLGSCIGQLLFERLEDPKRDCRQDLQAQWNLNLKFLNFYSHHYHILSNLHATPNHAQQKNQTQGRRRKKQSVKEMEKKRKQNRRERERYKNSSKN